MHQDHADDAISMVGHHAGDDPMDADIGLLPAPRAESH
jgi:hypothetical protein